jgi:hypothetical protein
MWRDEAVALSATKSRDSLFQGVAYAIRIQRDVAKRKREDKSTVMEVVVLTSVYAGFERRETCCERGIASAKKPPKLSVQWRRIKRYESSAGLELRTSKVIALKSCRVLVG